MNNIINFGSSALFNPTRRGTVEVEGVKISGDCLYYKVNTYPIGKHLFLSETGTILADPQIMNTSPPEVQYLGTVVNSSYILITLKRLPVIL